MAEGKSSPAVQQAAPLKWYAVYINRLCGRKTPSRKILSDICNIKSILTSRKIDLSVGCTQSDTQQCQIFKDLKLWNEFLWVIDAELKEVAPGRLGVVPERSCDPDTVCGDRYYHASILLHWLLREHRCIEVFELERRNTYRDMDLLADTLRVSTGIRRLKLSKFDYLPRSLVGTLVTLSKLEDLELCLVTMSKHALAHFQLVLENMPSLKSLKLDLRSMSLNKTKALLQALKQCAATSLCINGSCLKLDNGRAFAEFLADSNRLKELTIDHMAKREVTQDVKALFRALRTNEVLEKLRLPCCCLTIFEARLLVRVMAMNTTLKALQVGSTNVNASAAFAELIGSNKGLLELEITTIPSISELPAPVRRNTAMKKLSFNCKYLSVQSTESFLDALASNESLELVRLGSIYEQEPGDFHRLLEEKGLDSRVHYECYIGEPGVYMSNRKSTGNPRRARLPSWDPRLDTVRRVCRQLACPHQFVELSISLDRLDHESARLLSGFLSSTKVLKRLHITFMFADSFSAAGLLNGLCCNESLSSVALDFVFEEDDVEMMGALVRDSTNLREITVLSPAIEFGEYCEVISELATCLVDNYFLLNVTTSDYTELANDVFEIKDIMRRNGSMLFDAAQFAMGSCAKKHAEAFERLFESEALAEKLQELAHETDSEARETIKKRLQYLDYNFMTVAGIVKVSVICERDERQETQLDQIAFDTWLQIRSYLKIKDIVDEPVVLRLPA